MYAGKGMNNKRTVEGIHHPPDLVASKSSAELGISARIAKFLHLIATSCKNKPVISPRLIEKGWNAFGRNQSAKEDVAVERNNHFCALAQTSASSTIAPISSSLRCAVAAFA